MLLESDSPLAEASLVVGHPRAQELLRLHLGPRRPEAPAHRHQFAGCLRGHHRPRRLGKGVGKVDGQFQLVGLGDPPLEARFQRRLRGAQLHGDAHGTKVGGGVVGPCLRQAGPACSLRNAADGRAGNTGGREGE